ncbi:MAG: carboxypeptidase-like regulatory domain-containing protein, partial [Ignavibacteria bacterium]|nr:carboxypeptidase-like regulatory domain-containing protein [Ignavibacteria bacterium]
MNLKKINSSLPLILIFLILISTSFLLAQQSDESGSIQGTVKDKTGEVLIGANVLIKETKFGVSTNHLGKFFFAKIKPGTYTIDVSHVGYKKESKSVTVRKSEVANLEFHLETSAFKIGEIEVVGTQELIPSEAHTKMVISGSEIEHYQASSIG